RVPGPNQVLLKVRVAELNRTALREIGADLIYRHQGNLVGTNIGAGNVMSSGVIDPVGRGLIANADITRAFFDTSPSTTVFGLFEGVSLEFLIRALRRNSLLKILAEPNLVAMNGQAASFLAGGEFPIPISQGSAVAPTVTVQFKEFGVRLTFVPHI